MEFRRAEMVAWELSEILSARTYEQTCKYRHSDGYRTEKSTVLSRWVSDLWEAAQLAGATNDQRLE